MRMFPVRKVKMFVEKIINTSLEKVKVELEIGSEIYLKSSGVLQDVDVKNLAELIKGGKVFISLGETTSKFMSGKRE